VSASNEVLIADRDNFVVRAIGQPTFTPRDCTGAGAATCIPGGGRSSTDCLTEFKVATSAPNLSCIDGDPACDADESPNGQCTFRMGICLNNQDTRLGCTTGAIVSVRLTGKLARGAGAQVLLDGLRELTPTTTLGNGRGLNFDGAFRELNRCTPAGDFVVARKKRKGTGTLGAVTTSSPRAKDKDKLKLRCLAPQ
jgi:hypothetical protein